MLPSRNVIIAGAGIGGLTAALALARKGFRVSVLEQAERLSETGAGIQLTPNATRILISLGLGDRLRASAFTPQGISIKTATGGRPARVTLGEDAERHYGAPYWTMHRADLQAALLEAVTANPDIALKLNTRVEDFALHSNGMTVACRQGPVSMDEQAVALIGADGLWSALRVRLGQFEPGFRHRTAWRALIPIEKIEDEEFTTPDVQLWLGKNAHVVHYPVRGGKLINVVAIIKDKRSKQGWSMEGAREELLSHFSAWSWCLPLREFLALPERWLGWSLYDMPPFSPWGKAEVTLLGDAAHPILPFLAQGAAMAIEDAIVLADNMAQRPDDIATAMRRYEATRQRRTARVQGTSRKNGRRYHAMFGEALARDLYLRVAGGRALLRRYDWIYDWRFQGSDAALQPPALPDDPAEGEQPAGQNSA